MKKQFEVIQSYTHLRCYDFSLRYISFSAPLLQKKIIPYMSFSVLTKI